MDPHVPSEVSPPEMRAEPRAVHVAPAAPSRADDWLRTALVAAASSAGAVLAAWLLVIGPQFRAERASLAQQERDAMRALVREELARAVPAPSIAAVVTAPPTRTAAPARADEPVDLAPLLRESQRVLLEQDLSGVGMAKVAIAEFMLSNGRAPNGNAEAGLPAPDSFRGDRLRSLNVGADGAIELDFGDAHARLVPAATDYAVRWSCTTDLAELVDVIPACDAGG